MRVYEELFIVRPDATEEEIDPLVEQLRGVVASGGGNVEKVDKWGVRKLAYRVAKRTEGYYILLVFSSSPEAVKEVERRLRVSDLVLKHITVRIDEKMKRIEKRKKAREKRAARKPAPQVAGVPETAQVVPPGFMPDPEYTWVPRTNVETRPRTTYSTPSTTESTTSTETTRTATSSPTETTSGTDTTVPTTSGPHIATTVVDPDGPGPLPPTTVTQSPVTSPGAPVPNRSGTPITTTTVLPGAGPAPALPPAPG